MTETWTPLKLRSANQGIIFEGEASGAGGGSAPVQGNYSGQNVVVANGATEQPPFTTFHTGTELLDRTDPVNPVFLAAGTYSVQVVVQGNEPLTAGGCAAIAISVGAANGDDYFGSIPGSPGAGSVTVVSEVQAGDPITLLITNGDGVTARSFGIGSATIVKLA